MVLFQDLFASKDVLNLTVYLSFLTSVEYIVYCLQLVINHKEVTLIFPGAAPFVENCYVSFDQVVLLKAQ